MWQVQHLFDAGVYVLVLRALHVDTPLELMRLSLLLSLMAITGLAAWAALVAPTARWRAARLTVLGPVTAVMLFWLGFYDPVTALCWVVVLFAWATSRTWGIVLAAVPLGFQHFEQGMLGALTLYLVWSALRSQLPERLAMTSPLPAMVGVLVGKGLLILVMVLNGQAVDARGRWVDMYLVDWSRMAIVMLPILVWSLFGGLWPLVVATWLRSERTRARALLAAALALGIVGQLLAADRPRVFVMIMLPSVMVAIVAYVSNASAPVREQRVVESVAWLAPPVLLSGLVVVNANVVDTAVPAWLRVLGFG